MVVLKKGNLKSRLPQVNDSQRVRFLLLASATRRRRKKTNTEIVFICVLLQACVFLVSRSENIKTLVPFFWGRLCMCPSFYGIATGKLTFCWGGSDRGLEEEESMDFGGFGSL